MPNSILRCGDFPAKSICIKRHRYPLQHENTSKLKLFYVQILSCCYSLIVLPPPVQTLPQLDPNPNTKPKPNPSFSQQLHSPIHRVQKRRGSSLVSEFEDSIGRLGMDREEKPGREVSDRFWVNFNRGIGESKINRRD